MLTGSGHTHRVAPDDVHGHACPRGHGLPPAPCVVNVPRIDVLAVPCTHLPRPPPSWGVVRGERHCPPIRQDTPSCLQGLEGAGSLYGTIRLPHELRDADSSWVAGICQNSRVPGRRGACAV